MGMRLSAIVLIAAGLSVSGLTLTPAQAWDRGTTEIFAVLPDGATGPEGLTVAPSGNVFATTFGFNAAGPVTGLGQLYVFNKNGKLLRQVGIANSSSHLLGLGFHPYTGALLVIDYGNAQVLNVNRKTGASHVFMKIPEPFASSAGLNALTFDQIGNVYVSDSFNGIIWRTHSNGGIATAWVSDPLLTTSGVPPFGANGLAINSAQEAMFVANTGNDTVVKIPIVCWTAGTPEVFVNGINGADGIAIDGGDNLWVAANQSDEIVGINTSGLVFSKLGDFQTVTDAPAAPTSGNPLPVGTPIGLLFPASLGFSPDGKSLYVTNLALDLRLFGLVQAVDSRWAARVTHYTISKITTPNTRATKPATKAQNTPKRC